MSDRLDFRGVYVSQSLNRRERERIASRWYRLNWLIAEALIVLLVFAAFALFVLVPMAKWLSGEPY